jgi:hypothetical protein
MLVTFQSLDNLVNRFILLCLIAASLATAGCEEINYSIEGSFNAGTLKGVQICIERIESPLVHHFMARDICAQQHQKSLPQSIIDDHAELTAGFDFATSSYSEQFFNVYYENNTDSWIVTAVSVRVDVRNESGNWTTVLNGRSDVSWINPGQNQTISFPRSAFNSVPERSQIIRQPNFDETGENWRWTLIDVKGVEIRI